MRFEMGSLLRGNSISRNVGKGANDFFSPYKRKLVGKS
jgi:hypothetical protein